MTVKLTTLASVAAFAMAAASPALALIDPAALQPHPRGAAIGIGGHQGVSERRSQVGLGRYSRLYRGAQNHGSGEKRD